MQSEENGTDSATMLCGTNGVTYPSLCHLLQDTRNEGVAYVGSCGSEECSGGNVSSATCILSVVGPIESTYIPVPFY